MSHLATYVNGHMYTQAYTYVATHLHAHTHIHIHTHIHTHAHTCTHTCIHMHTHAHTHTHTCIHKHTHSFVMCVRYVYFIVGCQEGNSHDQSYRPTDGTAGDRQGHPGDQVAWLGVHMEWFLAGLHQRATVILLGVPKPYLPQVKVLLGWHYMVCKFSSVYTSFVSYPPSSH